MGRPAMPAGLPMPVGLPVGMPVGVPMRLPVASLPTVAPPPPLPAPAPPPLPAEEVDQGVRLLFMGKGGRYACTASWWLLEAGSGAGAVPRGPYPSENILLAFTGGLINAATSLLCGTAEGAADKTAPPPAQVWKV